MSFVNAPGQPKPAPRDPDDDLWLESKNYWAGHTGSEDPPAPSYRMIDGQMVLGRYMDPWGCQWLMNRIQRIWKARLDRLFPSVVGTTAAGLIYPTMFLGLAADWALYQYERNQAREIFMYYHWYQQEMHRTGEPVWVPYDSYRGQGPEAWP